MSDGTGSYAYTHNVMNCIRLVTSLLVFPPALASLFALTYRSIRQGRFFATLPLLFTQLNTVFIWVVLGCFVVGYERYSINGKEFIQASIFGFKYNALTTFMPQVIVLEPLNLFLYTWRFLITLEQEA